MVNGIPITTPGISVPVEITFEEYDGYLGFDFDYYVQDKYALKRGDDAETTINAH